MSTICINNNLTACQACITMGAANNKFPGGVYKESEIAVKKLLNSCRKQLLDSWYQNFPDIFFNLYLHGFFSGFVRSM